jgi:TonB family protein
MKSSLVTVCMVIWFFTVVSAQEKPNGHHNETSLVITKLSQPIYPPLAKQMKTIGHVEVKVNVKQDGSLKSASVVSGNVLFRQAALESAMHSQFECKNCGPGVRSFRIRYSFDLKASCATTAKPANGDAYPMAVVSQNVITVTDSVAENCEPLISKKIRSIRCLYLWKCGVIPE